MTKVYIYALCDPDTKQPIYVGQTVNTRIRLRSHLAEANLDEVYGNRKKGDWILSLKARGKKPELQVLEEVEHPQADDTEYFWINKLRFEGHTLINADFKRPGMLNRLASEGKLKISY